MVKNYPEPESDYHPHPVTSPYAEINPSRLGNPKFTFRYALDLVGPARLSEAKSWLDVGTGNGEFLHFLANSVTTENLSLWGIDSTTEFVTVGQTLLADFENVEIKHADLFRTTTHDFPPADIVSCLGTMPIFPDPSGFLAALMKRTTPGGLVVVDGRINIYDCSVVLQYRDDSVEATRGLWRCDFNIHSARELTRILEELEEVKSFGFYYPQIDVDIPKDKRKPHINVWTEQMAGGGGGGYRH